MVSASFLPSAVLALGLLARSANAHIAWYHPSMWGFNVTAQSYSYDNRPMVPLMQRSFNDWWFHGHLDHPPNAGDFFELPAGGTATGQLACDKGATDFYASDPGGDVRQGDYPCPNSPTTAFHANNIEDVTGCGLAITYKSDVTQVQPEDFAIFSTNRTCPWTRYTNFDVPAAMPECPEEGCICAWFWIHAPDSGAEQNYMNGFRCKVTGATATAPIMKAELPRRCGADPANGKPDAVPSNCTQGASQPFYWYQNERNNMFEGTYSPPLYNELYGYPGGALNNIFEGGSGAPAPAPSTQSAAPAPPATSKAPATTAVPAPAPTTSKAAAPPPGTTSKAVAPPPATTSKAVNPPPATTNKAVASPPTTIVNVASPPPAAPSSEAAKSTAAQPSTATYKPGTSTATSSGLAAAPSTTRRCKAKASKRSAEARAAADAAAETEKKRSVAAHKQIGHIMRGTF